MKKRLAVSFAVLFVLACSTTATQDSGHAALSGSWSFNYGQSDDGREVLRRALRDDDSGDAAARVEKKEAAAQRLDQLLGAAELMDIKVKGARITVATFTGERVYFTDGRGAKKGRPDLDATWDGTKLITVSNGGGTSIRQSWELTPDSGQLHVVYEIEGPMFTRPVTIRRVYDRW